MRQEERRVGPDVLLCHHFAQGGRGLPEQARQPVERGAAGLGGGGMQGDAAPGGEGDDAGRRGMTGCDQAHDFGGTRQRHRLPLLRHADAEHGGPGVHRANDDRDAGKGAGADLADDIERVLQRRQAGGGPVDQRKDRGGIAVVRPGEPHGRKRIAGHDPGQLRDGVILGQEHMGGRGPERGMG